MTTTSKFNFLHVNLRNNHVCCEKMGKGGRGGVALSPSFYVHAVFRTSSFLVNYWMIFVSNKPIPILIAMSVRVLFFKIKKKLRKILFTSYFSILWIKSLNVMCLMIIYYNFYKILISCLVKLQTIIYIHTTLY